MLCEGAETEGDRSLTRSLYSMMGPWGRQEAGPRPNSARGTLAKIREETAVDVSLRGGLNDVGRELCLWTLRFRVALFVSFCGTVGEGSEEVEGRCLAIHSKLAQDCAKDAPSKRS